MPEPHISILVPCFREEENIPELVRRLSAVMEKEKNSWEIVLVDDGSPDRTWEQIQKFTALDSRIRGIRHSSNQGIVGGWHTAMENASGDWVVTMDADMQYAPEDIPTLIYTMEESGCDLVQGIRTTRFEPKHRIFLSVGFSKLLALLFQMPLEDVKSGFVLYKKQAFAEILKHRNSFRLFQHWIIVTAFSLGYRIRQVPVTFSSRKAGQSFITYPLGFALRAFLELPGAMFYFKRLRQSRG